MSIILWIAILLVTVAVINRFMVMKKSHEGFSSNQYCRETEELPGFKGSNGTCADVRGVGVRQDYCRIVTPTRPNGNNNRFIACDIGSRGGFNQWFRSPVESIG